MLLLLPPSESKRPGGDPGRPLDLAALSRPALTGPRRTALARLRELSSDLTAAAAALGLGPRNRDEAALNREVRRGPTLPAIERFDGVLYDALDQGSLDAEAREWLGAHVAIASALFGLVGPDDRIPAYRLSADTRLRSSSLGAIWRTPLSRILADVDGPVIDLRSEAYAALGPAPGAAFVRVVTDLDGRRRALNHFNKAAKGDFVRRLARDRPDLATIDDLRDWARSTGIALLPGDDGGLVLVASGPPTVGSG